MAEIEFRPPRPEEVALKRRWQADPRLMSYNAGWDVSYPGYHPETGCIDFPEDQWASWYERFVGSPPPGTGYWFVESGGEVVGHAHHRREDADDPRVAAIGFLIVPERRGEGLAYLVLSELLRRCFAAGFQAVRNEFEDSRQPARALHERAGFEVVPGSAVETGGRTVLTFELSRERFEARKGSARPE